MAALKVIAQSSPDIEFDPDDIAICLPSDAQLDPGAGEAILGAFAEHPEAAALYGDRRVNGQRQARAAWSPTRVQSEPGVSLPLAVRASWPQFDPSRDPLELERRLAESDAVVLHIPSVLTNHHSAPSLSGRTLADDHRFEPGERPGTRRRRPHLLGQANTSIIIPSAGISQPDAAQSMLARCLETLTLLDPPPLEVIVVVGDEFQGQLPGERDRGAIGLSTHAIHRGAGPFDFSQAANSGLRASQGDLVLLLNDDIEAESPDWLGRMAAHLQDPAVGAVGAALLYPNRTVQHVGVVIDDAHPLHPFVGYRLADTANHGGDVARDVIAVTGACVLARRRDLLAIGGLSPDFPSSFGDIDLCLRLRRSGLRVVAEPAAVLTHHETASREPVIEPWEKDRFAKVWGHVTDPWYHPAFHRPHDPRSMSRNADHLGPVDQHGTWAVRTTAIADHRHQPPMSQPDSSKSPSEFDTTDDIDIARIPMEIEAEADVLRRRDPQMNQLEREMEQQWDALRLPEPSVLDQASPVNTGSDSSRDADSPTGSNLVNRLFKRLLRRATRRYTQYVLFRVNELLHAIRQRLRDQQDLTDQHSQQLHDHNRHFKLLENTMSHTVDNSYLVTSHLLDPPPELKIDAISTIAKHAGPVPSLVLSGGTGEIVRSINTNGGYAYGLEPDAGRVLRAIQEGLDVRSDDIIGHLSRLDTDQVSTIVLTGVVEFMPSTILLAIIEQVARIIATSGHVIVAVADPENRNPIESELYAGLGFSPSTWRHLLDRDGFDTRIEPVVDPHLTELVIAERKQKTATPTQSPTEFSQP